MIERDCFSSEPSFDVRTIEVPEGVRSLTIPNMEPRLLREVAYWQARAIRAEQKLAKRRTKKRGKA